MLKNYLVTTLKYLQKHKRIAVINLIGLTVGLTVSFFAFLIILYALWSKVHQGNIISGWTSLIISTMFIGGVQLICLGILGEYIDRINHEVRGRPLYVVRGTSEAADDED